MIGYTDIYMIGEANPKRLEEQKSMEELRLRVQDRMKEGYTETGPDEFGNLRTVYYPPSAIVRVETIELK